MSDYFYRKVISIPATKTPNVAYALSQKRRGIKPDGKVLVPGILTYDDYCHRLATWDQVRISAGILAKFYEGSGVLLYPPEWLDRAEAIHAKYPKGEVRIAQAIGVDSAEGGDSTALVAVDKKGVIEIRSVKTPDTNVIAGEVLSFAMRWGLLGERRVMVGGRLNLQSVVFDRGGGGKQIADQLRGMGYDCRTVAFNEAIGLPIKHRDERVQYKEKKEVQEERSIYKDRKAQMYGDLHDLLRPTFTEAGEDTMVGFAIPANCMGNAQIADSELRHQMAPIPMTYDDRQKMYILPKRKKGTVDPLNLEGNQSGDKTLVELIGHSPDELDALVLACFGMLHKTVKKEFWIK